MPSPNQRVGEYVLQERVAAGTFGEVWRACHHVWSDQLVAVKIPTDPQYLRNLQREGIAIHGLAHPNVVRAISFDPYADPPYLTTEFVQGASLRTLIAKGPLAPKDVVAVMRQVLAGLSYAHAKGIVHRDVKPENILVHERAFADGFATEGAVKVTDFGLGKSSTGGAAAAGSILYSASLNDPAAKEIAGTLDYMAPEQRAGDAVDPRADVYACGVVLFEMLTGERPAGTDLPSDVNPAVPKHLDEAFRRSYARLDKRFATADEFARALAAQPPVLNRVQASKPPPPLPSSPLPLLHRTAWAEDRPSTASPPLRPASSDLPWALSQRSGCPQCRQQIDAGDQFCMHCGVQLVENVRRCPQCGAYPDTADHYCIFCGQALTTSHVSVT
jgi:serine/threonine-protein kinase